MKNFLSGVLFATIGITFLNTISEIGANLGQLLNAKLAIQIQKCNVSIQNIVDPPTKSEAIGFIIPDTEEDSDE